MIRVFPAFAVSLGLALVTGCATTPQPQFDPGPVANVKVIGLLDVQEPPDYTAVNVGGASAMFGALGGIAQNKSNKAQSGRFTEVIRRDFNAARRMEQQLTERLKAKGYQVVALAGKRPVLKGDRLDYSGIETDADVFLEVGLLSVGYLSGFNNLGYDPSLMASARVISRESGDRLYFQMFAYGARMGNMKGWDILSAPTGSSVASFDDLIRDPQKSAAALQAGVDAIAARIAAGFP